MARITYTDKEYLNENASVPAINKVQDIDMNEIKSVINDTLLTALGLDTDTFSTSTAYSSGDLVVYDNKIYQFTASHTGAWTGTDVTLVPIIDRVTDNEQDIITLNNMLDMFNDTSGSDWKEMMKNKIDYCIDNINTTKTNAQTFINGGWYGVNYGLGMFSKTGPAYQLIWISSDATYFCRKLGDNTYLYTNITGRDEGTATVNNTYISSVEYNHYEKYGRVVSYSFTMTVKGSWSTTTQFLSGLPKAQRDTRFIGLNTSNQQIMRFAIDNNGNITSAFSYAAPDANQVIEGHVTYIASE